MGDSEEVAGRTTRGTARRRSSAASPAKKPVSKRKSSTELPPHKSDTHPGTTPSNVDYNAAYQSWEREKAERASSGHENGTNKTLSPMETSTTTTTSTTSTSTTAAASTAAISAMTGSDVAKEVFNQTDSATTEGGALAVSDPPPALGLGAGNGAVVSTPNGASNGGNSGSGHTSAEFQCPICHDQIHEAFVTHCGHSFCYLCILGHLDVGQVKTCPVCGAFLSRSQIFPNFALNNVITRLASEPKTPKTQADPTDINDALVEVEPPHSALRTLGFAFKSPGYMSISEINAVVAQLLGHKRQLEADQGDHDLDVLKKFLDACHETKTRALMKLKEELSFLEEDLGIVEKFRVKAGAMRASQAVAETDLLNTLRATDPTIVIPPASAGGDRVVGDGVRAGAAPEKPPSSRKRSLNDISADGSFYDAHGRRTRPRTEGTSSSSTAESGAPPGMSLTSASSAAPGESALFKSKLDRVMDHFDGLQECYFETRRRYDTSSRVDVSPDSTEGAGARRRSSANGGPSTSTSSAQPTSTALTTTTSTNARGPGQPIGSQFTPGLRNFSLDLSRFTRYSRFRVLATLTYGDILNSSSIVSSIEFDRNDEYFATAGVTKKIKIFEYNTIVNDPVDMHYPVREMQCSAKISCLSWNSYIRAQIASSDYEGVVSLWDATTGRHTTRYDEHEKRVWSVDFSQADPTVLASGSDDTKVKIWSTKSAGSVGTIESKANICCVKFNPDSAHNLAFGSADHHIHYYDLRQPKEALRTFKGHRKAVSYVKFLNTDELVSASTDSSLKLWSLKKPDGAIRTFRGHSNEKNFVGLTTNGDYISCGSENNSVVTYYKSLSEPIVVHKFTRPEEGQSHVEPVQFVSSVCWKKNSKVLLAANSLGTIQALELAP